MLQLLHVQLYRGITGQACPLFFLPRKGPFETVQLSVPLR